MTQREGGKKKKGSLTNYSQSAYCIYPSSKEELFMDFTIQECELCLVVHADNNFWFMQVSDNLQIGQVGKNICRNIIP